MLTAYWLSLALPTWWLLASFAIANGDALSWIALGGLCGLLLGLYGAGTARTEMLRWYLLSVGISQVFVMVAGFYRGHLDIGPTHTMVLMGFLGIQAIYLSYLVIRFRAKTFTAFAFSVFAASYAGFAHYVAHIVLAELPGRV